MTAAEPVPGDAGEHPVFRPAGISYLHIPAAEPARSAEFYRAVFGWTIGGDERHPSFEDGTGHVIGRWVTDLPVVGQAGLMPFVYVERVDDVLAAIEANGGAVVRAPFPEGDLWVATFRDPAGNVLGVWQHGDR